MYPLDPVTATFVVFKREYGAATPRGSRRAAQR
jgi:hypothetical protein